MKKQKMVLLTVCSVLLFSACSGNNENAIPNEPIEEPVFANASVHDPSIIKVDDHYYVFGSHLAVAKSADLQSWEQLNAGVYDGNPIIPDVLTAMAEELGWAQTETFWAGDVIQLPDGKYYMYYSMCKGDSPRSVLGYAVADQIEGPYTNKGIILKSGMWNSTSADGTVYDATVHPNVVDPHVFYDKDGILWMVYGSYSGGIFIMKMNPETGLPYPDQGYGKKLLGSNHSRIEAPYMMYSKETDYYYLFLSFGGLDANGGYNIRIARSKNPDGPFLDSEGKDMLDAYGAPGTVFDDLSIAPYGVKLMGNFQMDNVEGELAGASYGYVSPGHNSTYVDPENQRMYIIFHTRFPNRGEEHEVRVHQMLMNSEGWPVVAPHRYAGEAAAKVSSKQIIGDYKFVNHGKDITDEVKEASVITLAKNGKISGSVSGTWKSTGDYTLDLTIDGTVYHGALLKAWSESTHRYVMTFSALSEEGTAIWGSHVAKD